MTSICCIGLTGSFLGVVSKLQSILKTILTICSVLMLLSGCGQDPVMPLASPAGANSSSPNASVTNGGLPVLSWQRRQQDTTFLEYSVLSEEGWSQPVEVARGTDWFVNWADIPAVQQVTDGFWAAHYLQRTPGGKYAYDVRLRISNDGGKSWRDGGSPHQDGTLTEHGFVSLYAQDQRLGIIWLDGRETHVPENSGDHHGSHGSHGGMTLRAAVMDAQGQYTRRQQIDALVCDCCQTAAVMTSDGPLVIYRDRTESEQRDIASSRWLDGDWTLPQPVGVDGWQINGCPVNGPVLMARQNDVAALWFSGANGQSQIFLARSTNGGETFGSKLKVNDERALGRVTALMYPDRSLLLAWMRENANGSAHIVGRFVNSNNELGPIVELVEVSPKRASGFPKLLRSDLGPILAWTDQSDATPRIRTLIINDSALK